MQSYHPSFRRGAPQQPPPTQPYAPQQFSTSQPIPPPSTQSQPQPPSVSRKDLEGVLETGTRILQLVDRQTRAVQTGEIAEAVRLSEQCDQEMTRYEQRSEFVVRALEARRAEAKAVLDQWIQPSSHPTGESTESNNGRRSVTLRWSHMGKSYQTRVLTADIMGNPLAEPLPELLQLEGLEWAMDIRGFQEWIRNVRKKTGNEPSMVEFQPAPETERHNFNQLIKWLREGKVYAVARWAIRSGGSSTPNLIIRPCPDGQEPGLVGAVFPVSGIPPLPQPQLQQLPRPQADFSHTVDMQSVPASGGVGHMQQAHHPSVYGGRANVAVSGLAAQPMSSQDYQQRQLHRAYSQGRQSQPQAPQNQQRSWQETQHAETGTFGATRGEDTDSVMYSGTEWSSYLGQSR